MRPETFNLPFYTPISLILTSNASHLLWYTGTTLYKKVAEIIPTLPSRATQAKKAGGPKKNKK